MGRNMGRPIQKLSARACKTLGPGMHADGGNLYLQVTTSGARTWIFRYQREGKTRDMGLGPFHAIGLAEARQKATEARSSLANGIDPLGAKRAAAQQQRFPFRVAAEQFVESHRAGWKNVKHAAQWVSTLEAYAHPVIGDVPLHEVSTDHLIAILTPIWSTKTETASRVRQRIEAILDWGKARGMREGENPARWKGHLDHLLPKPNSVRTVKHFAAMPYSDLPAFMSELRERTGIDARALELTVMTAARTGMVIGARFEEFQNGCWHVPGSRMKGTRARNDMDFIIPLPSQVIELVSSLRTGSDYLFPSSLARAKHISTGAMDALMQRMDRNQFTVHGFRSAFKDWAAEKTHVENIVSEAALAHVVSDKVEAAYRRGDMLEKRRALMQAWADFIRTR